MKNLKFINFKAFFGTLFLCSFIGVMLAYGAEIFGYPKFQAFDSSGDPLSGGLLYTWEPGSATSKIAYKDYQCTTGHANPIVLDSRGEETIYFDGSYKLQLKDSDQTTIWTIDNFRGSGEYYASGASGTFCVWGPSGTSEIRSLDKISGVSLEDTYTKQNEAHTGGVSSVGQDIIGDVPIINLTSDVTIWSGTCTWCYGGYLGNYGASSGVSIWLMMGARSGMSMNISLDQDQTSGSSIWVIFNDDDVLLNDQDFVTTGTAFDSGTSYYDLSGSTGSSITLIGKGVSAFRVYTEGSPSKSSVQ